MKKIPPHNENQWLVNPNDNRPYEESKKVNVPLHSPAKKKPFEGKIK